MISSAHFNPLHPESLRARKRLRTFHEIAAAHKLTPQQLDHARDMIRSGEETRAAMATMFGVDVATLRRAMRGQAIS